MGTVPNTLSAYNYIHIFNYLLIHSFHLLIAATIVRPTQHTVLIKTETETKTRARMTGRKRRKDASFTWGRALYWVQAFYPVRCSWRARGCGKMKLLTERPQWALSRLSLSLRPRRK
jgi:hypothetical protein